MDAVGEEVKAVTYNHCQFYFPDGDFRCVADRESYRSAIRRFAGDGAVAEWDALEEAMLPLGDMALATPFAAMRGDAGVALTLGPYLPAMLGAGLSYGAAGLASLPLLQGYFSTLVDKYVTDPWLKRMLDLECFVISGLTAKETSAAEMAFLFRERHREGAEYDYPLGGSQALVDALVRGVRKFGGSVTLRAPVERFLVEDGRVPHDLLDARGLLGPLVRVSRPSGPRLALPPLPRALATTGDQPPPSLLVLHRPHSDLIPLPDCPWD